MLNRFRDKESFSKKSNWFDWTPPPGCVFGWFLWVMTVPSMCERMCGRFWWAGWHFVSINLPFEDKRVCECGSWYVKRLDWESTKTKALYLPFDDITAEAWHLHFSVSVFEDNGCYYKDTGEVILRFFRPDISKAGGTWVWWMHRIICLWKLLHLVLLWHVFYCLLNIWLLHLVTLSFLFTIQRDRKEMLQYTQMSMVWLRMMKLFAIIKTKVAGSFFFFLHCHLKPICVWNLHSPHCLCMLKGDTKWFGLSRQFRRVKINLVLL